MASYSYYGGWPNVLFFLSVCTSGVLGFSFSIFRPASWWSFVNKLASYVSNNKGLTIQQARFGLLNLKEGLRYHMGLLDALVFSPA